MVDMWEDLSSERKTLQAHSKLPDWMETGGWQLFKEKYLHEADGMADTFSRIAKTMARHTDRPAHWSVVFYDLLWNGWLIPSTPILSNAGTNKGFTVSCAGQYVGDSIDEFYKNYHEAACLTKKGFGTSGYLGDVRPRGSLIAAGGEASGVAPVMKGFVNVMQYVSQGSSRRGSFAGYYDIDGEDFWEAVNLLETAPDDLNVGWNVSNAFINALEEGQEGALERFSRTLKVKAVTGKGYYHFIDRVNAASPEWYKEKGYEVHNSNLCTEISLYNNEKETFTCVLSSLNLAKYDEWKDTTAVFDSIVFLDCVAEEFLQQSKGVFGFSKAHLFTKKNRALGLGTLGFHTMLQKKSIPIESLDAHMLNNTIYKEIKDEATEATKWLAEVYGEPKNLLGTGRRNSHLLAIAPNTSSALIAGGVSQGIEPVVANVYNQQSAAGNIYRVNPVFLDLAKERVGWTEELKQDIIDHLGSVQHLDWLTDHEKLVFKTAYEIDHKVLIRLASYRQRFICHSQSLNLFFNADEDEEYIAEVHREAFLDPYIKSLYYMRTQAGVIASKGECISCGS